ncbi:MAG: 3'(2'),5'-bisphosphate nucleotidase CysQ, partial [Hyphomicrobium sp.]|nr:3'(2'),5'-bisphosphate nucleotidase CysQ [Hyphomicrobium sp.]
AQLAISSRTELQGARLAGPRGWLRTGAIQATGAELVPHIPSLAYRFGLVAAGRVDAAFASPNAHDWDLAATDLLVHEAGGRLIGLDGTVPCYNQDIPRHGVLASANDRLLPSLLSAVRDAAGEIQHGR